MDGGREGRLKIRVRSRLNNIRIYSAKMYLEIRLDLTNGFKTYWTEQVLLQ